MGVLRTVSKIPIQVGVIAWDNALFLANLVLPSLKKGHVIPEGHPGFEGHWPPYVAPGEGDSRSACPMLNALANHGILPHDGKNIAFKELNHQVRQNFNFAPTFCFFASHFAAGFMDKSYWKDTFDLADLNMHDPKAIEHDASLTRHDVALQPDQGKPDLELVAQLLECATGKAEDGSVQLTPEDLAKALSKRRAEARRSNKEYSETKFHNFFGSANSSTMLTIFDGRVPDLTPMLTEERFVEGWEPRRLDHYGLAMAGFNGLVLKLEKQVDPKKYE